MSTEKKEYVVVDKQALIRVLNALNGHPHEIRELQVIRGLSKLPGEKPSPIDVLIQDVQSQETVVEAFRTQLTTNTPSESQHV